MDGGSHIIALVILLALSAYFSASETAFTSFNKAKMKTDADEGTVKAGLALKLNENYDGIIVTHGTDSLHYSACALQSAFSSSDIQNSISHTSRRFFSASSTTSAVMFSSFQTIWKSTRIATLQM